MHASSKLHLRFLAVPMETSKALSLLTSSALAPSSSRHQERVLAPYCTSLGPGRAAGEEEQLLVARVSTRRASPAELVSARCLLCNPQHCIHEAIRSVSLIERKIILKISFHGNILVK